MNVLNTNANYRYLVTNKHELTRQAQETADAAMAANIAAMNANTQNVQ